MIPILIALSLVIPVFFSMWLVNYTITYGWPLTECSTGQYDTIMFMYKRGFPELNSMIDALGHSPVNNWQYSRLRIKYFDIINDMEISEEENKLKEKRAEFDRWQDDKSTEG